MTRKVPKALIMDIGSYYCAAWNEKNHRPTGEWSMRFELQSYTKSGGWHIMVRAGDTEWDQGFAKDYFGLGPLIRHIQSAIRNIETAMKGRGEVVNYEEQRAKRKG